MTLASACQHLVTMTHIYVIGLLVDRLGPIQAAVQSPGLAMGLLGITRENLEWMLEMSWNPKLWRKVFAGAAILAVLTVAGAYLYGFLKLKKRLAAIPPKIASGLARSATGFTYSKSLGGR